MIEKIHIENFKSIQNLDLELGRINVFIGENGSGKTNILEAIGICSAAFNYKLDSDYIEKIGVRGSNSKDYKSKFNQSNSKKEIAIILSENGKNDKLILDYNSDEELFVKKGSSENFTNAIDNGKRIIDILKEFQKKVDVKFANAMILEMEDTLKIGASIDISYRKFFNIYNFLIFCPENTLLRRTDTEGHTKPLGIRGEGLLEYLSVLFEKEPETLDKIKEKLQVISWFEDFNIKTNFLSGGKSMELKDRYLAEGTNTIGLRNANEGFLFVLFYITLFMSKKTPKFFAIDNFDNALNPKLCRELMRIVAEIAKENDKQVIFTTHNPAVLDGLNLNDEEQKLFTVFRSKKTGETKVNIFKRQPTPQGVAPARLSEMFMNGALGGLPDNF